MHLNMIWVLLNERAVFVQILISYDFFIVKSNILCLLLQAVWKLSGFRWRRTEWSTGRFYWWGFRYFGFDQDGSGSQTWGTCSTLCSHAERDGQTLINGCFYSSKSTLYHKYHKQVKVLCLTILSINNKKLLWAKYSSYDTYYIWQLIVACGRLYHQISPTWILICK